MDKGDRIMKAKSFFKKIIFVSIFFTVSLRSFSSDECYRLLTTLKDHKFKLDEDEYDAGGRIELIESFSTAIERDIEFCAQYMACNEKSINQALTSVFKLINDKSVKKYSTSEKLRLLDSSIHTFRGLHKYLNHKFNISFNRNDEAGFLEMAIYMHEALALFSSFLKDSDIFSTVIFNEHGMNILMVGPLTTKGDFEEVYNLIGEIDEIALALNKNFVSRYAIARYEIYENLRAFGARKIAQKTLDSFYASNIIDYFENLQVTYKYSSNHDPEVDLFKDIYKEISLLISD